MKKYAKILSLFAALIMVVNLAGGCSRIPDSSDSESSDPYSSDNSSPEPVENRNESPVNEFMFNKQDFIAKLHAENGVFDGALSDDGEFDGTGYVKLRAEDTLTHILNANTAQHYRIILAARSTVGAAVTLEVGGTVCGAFYIPARVPNDFNALSFEYSAIDSVYLTPGQNVMRFYVAEGSVDIDYIIAESGSAVSSEYYSVGSACINPSASIHTVNVMKYFSEVYGNSVLTAQNVSPASNAEIDAVYNATGRYPAIRSGEIAYALSDGDENKKLIEKELELALDWTKKGGLQAYTWHWYSPNYRRGTEIGDFNLDGVFENQRPDEIALMGDEELAAHIDNGYMRSEIASLLKDIDSMAEVLKRFDSENATVLFHPLPDGDSGLYWWGRDPETYQILWRIVFDRMCRYHKLKSLIWVWDGSNMDYYPGDGYVDIIGQSFYETSDASFAGRFSSISSLTVAHKMLSVSSCDVLPNINYMFRDNAIWLWTAAGSGDFTLNMNGALSESYNSVQYVKFLYNCKNSIALDELPDFNIVI